jgi:uncharacterized membrane protein
MAVARGGSTRRLPALPRPTAAQALIAVTVLGGLLRFVWIDSKGYWQDEAATVLRIDHGFGAMLDAVIHRESTPPLYFALAWVWAKFFGSGEAGLRSLSAVLATATIPVAYLAARDLVSRRAGVVTALLVAVNPLLVWYAQEARSYALLVLLSTLSLLCLARALRASDERLPRAIAWWTLVAAATLVTHYFAFVLILPEGAWLLYRRGAARSVRMSGAVVLAVAAATVVLAGASHVHPEWISRISLTSRAAQIPGVFLVGFETPAPLVMAAIGAACAAVALYVLVTRATRPERDGVILPGLLAIVVVASGLALALAGHDYLLYRNVVHALVPALIVIGAGFAVRGAGVARLAALCVLCSISVAAVIATAHQPKYRKEVWREVAHAFGPASSGRAIVATPGGSAGVPLAVYLPGTRRMPRTGARLREVALVGAAYRQLGSFADPVTPRPASPPPPPAPGFALAGRRNGERFTIFIYRSAQARNIRPRDLADDAIAPTRAAILLQPK